MPEQSAELLIDCRNALGEMPVWSRESGTLYWIDVIRPGRLFHWKARTNQVDFWEFGHLLTGLDLGTDGSLLVRSAIEVFRFDPVSGQTSPVFSLPASCAGMRFNDGHCDGAGRLWVGTMDNNITDDGEPLTISRFSGQIWTIGGARADCTNAKLGCPNAICWSPDGGTFYVADSCDGWIYAYSFDCTDGAIFDPRPFCHLGGLGVPDGAAVDREGFIWNARWGAGAVARITPDGRLDRLVRVPTCQPTACCFGDDDLRTLYVTSARFALPEDKLGGERHAGGLFAITLDVAGLPAFRFRNRSTMGSTRQLC